MARENGGWVNTARPDRLKAFWTSNNVKRPFYPKKVYLSDFLVFF